MRFKYDRRQVPDCGGRSSRRGQSSWRFKAIHACRNLREVGSPAVTCLDPVNRMLLVRQSNPRAMPIAMRRQDPRHVEQGKILLIMAHPGPQPDLPSSDSMLSPPMPALWSETCASLGWCQAPLEGRPLFRSSRSTVPHFSLKKTSQGAHQRC